MKEISKYLQRFMNSTFPQDDFVLSPESISFLRERYNDIVEADSEWIKQKEAILSNAVPIDFSQSDEWKSGEHYNYLESHVKSHMSSTEKMGVKCRMSMFGQEISLFIVYPLPNHFSLKTISKKKQTNYYETLLRKMFLWLWIANKYRGKQCSSHLRIYLYLTDLPKLLNNDAIIGRNHVNTGFTLACPLKNEIYIFREEEWFKVFIHEIIHAFGIDFADSRLTPTQEMCQERIHRIFKVPHVNILVFEAFTEICAEMMNLLFFLYFEKDGIATNVRTNLSSRRRATENTIGFSPLKMAVLLKNEMEFSAFQCAKVLDHSSMEYSDLYTQSPYAVRKRKEYREDSNVLSYYVLKPVLLNHFNEFIQWMVTSNGGSFKFSTVSRNTDAFCNLIEDNYNKVEYVEKINMYSKWIRKHKRMNTIETKTLRMTMYE